MVTSGFWPISGSTEIAANLIANGIQDAGNEIEIVTIRWEKNWPLYFEFQGKPVHRINRPLAGPWGGFRYLKQVNRILSEIDPDGIIIFGLGDEAYSVTRAFSKKIPCVIRVDSHIFGASKGKPGLTSRQLAAIEAAERLVVDSQWTADRLALHKSVESAKVDIAADPIDTFAVKDDEAKLDTQISKGSARVAISDAHPILMIEPDQPLVVTAAPMDGDGGMLDLVAAWPRVLLRCPTARLWIVGEGKQSRRVWDSIREKELVHSIIMPGSFDELSDVFCAADVYVHPLHSDQSCSFLNLALAEGMCCVAYQSNMSDSLIEHDRTGRLVSQTPQALAESMIELLEQPETRLQLGQNAASWMKERLSKQDRQSANPFLLPFLQLGRGALGSQTQEPTPD